MAKIEDLDSWFTEFKEEMFTLFKNFSEDMTDRLQKIFVDVTKLNEKLDRFIDEADRQHEVCTIMEIKKPKWNACLSLQTSTIKKS
jgi:hypothetical protein